MVINNNVFKSQGDNAFVTSGVLSNIKRLFNTVFNESEEKNMSIEKKYIYIYTYIYMGKIFFLLNEYWCQCIKK